MRDAADCAVRSAFIAIGVSAAAMWVGVAGRPWPLPRWLAEIAERSMDSKTVGRLVPLCFVLGMFNFAYAVDFDIPLMFSYIGEQRWPAPWGRGQFGGWDAFLDQMQYFGYVLPSLTALLIARRGFTFPTWLSIVLSGIMLAFLSQGGGRRIIGVTVGAAILVWIQAQRELKVRRLMIAAAAAVGLLAAMQFMLNIRNVGYEEFMLRRWRDRIRLSARRRQLPAPGAGDRDRARRASVRRLPAVVVHDCAAGAARVLARQAGRSRLRPAHASSG